MILTTALKTRSEYLLPLMIVLLAGVVRLAVSAVFPDQGFPDARAYFRAGAALFENGVIGNTHAMPLYAVVSYLSGGWLPYLDILLSAATSFLIYLLALEMGLGRFSGILAATVTAVYPHFVFFSFSRLSETSFIFLVCLAFLLLYREKYFWGSVVIVLSILLRPTLDFLAPILILTFTVVVHQRGWPIILKNLLMYAAVYVALMTPWWIHNYHFYGEFVRLNLGDGTVWYAGNNPMNQSGGGIEGGANPDVDFTRFRAIDDPLERNAALKKEAFDYIQNNPGRFIELAGLKFLRFWRLWPYTKDYQSPFIVAVSLLSYGVFLFLSIGFLAKQGWARRRKILPVMLFAGYLTAIHMILIASVRYRLPLEPFIIIFGSYPLGHALARVFPGLPKVLGARDPLEG